jgi:hypothetical protein
MTGFGQVHPLPGIWDSFHLDSAVTLPVGVEAYAAYALRAWLSASATVSGRTCRFARWSAVGSRLRADLGTVLSGCPIADETIVVASELAANAVTRSSSSQPGGRFIVRAEAWPVGYVWV